jgi:PPOX class probable F420-dependent enzyme
MSQRRQIRMNSDEACALLAAGNTVHLATIGPDGRPHLVPMWYAMVDGRLTMWSYARAQKVLNLRRDDRLTCLVETGERYDELRGVSVLGRARIESDPDAVRRVGEAIWERHLGPLTDEARAAVAHQAPKRVAIIVEPERVVSWDHAKQTGSSRSW